tara:strand:- start:237 stop:425 length:189 start_codon:yes stop_codon:yes gene_type:complete
MTNLTETLRAAFATATIAHENAARSAYRAAGTRMSGLAKHREEMAWARRCDAERAYRAATVA